MACFLMNPLALFFLFSFFSLPEPTSELEQRTSCRCDGLSATTSRGLVSVASPREYIAPVPKIRFNIDQYSISILNINRTALVLCKASPSKNSQFFCFCSAPDMGACLHLLVQDLHGSRGEYKIITNAQAGSIQASC